MADTSKPDPAITDSKTLNSYHKGHRERMRAKVSADSTSILSDAEVLEMFLYGINSRGDTKPVEKTLLAKFKNISNIITADKAELRTVKGVGSAAIIHFHLIREIEQHMKRDLVKDKPILAN
jgi:DNA repair protein RadC